MKDLASLHALVEARREEMVEDMMAMSRIPSINPRMNGEGEYQRMQWIENWLSAHSITCEVIDVPDDAVKEGVRRNLLVKYEGTEDASRTLWIISHVDTVNTGDLSLWKTNPLEPVRKDGRIYGLGVEDNSQSVIESLHVCQILQDEGIRTKCNLAFLFASDEETGSRYGLHALLDRGLFSPDDEAIVPDGGSPDGAFVEIAEKSQVWLKFTVNGKQAHASMPHLGVNACSIGMHLGAEIEDRLKEKFGEPDLLFNPPTSTFELTQKFANVDSPNVMPGKDVFVMDLRILPRYTVDEVMAEIDAVIRKYENPEKGVTISYEFVTRVDAPPATPSDAPVVQKLVEAIRESGVDAYFGGIGGGTCGAILRAKNIPAVVWSTLDDLAHQPNEYVIIDNLVNDTKVYLTVIEKYCK
ncbi:M20 family metallo-hydrolase [Cuneatibacter sp. NSJ-177]|uniref:M20 family metallo-hydrolase n=1 Tax=Cuneatibacter sp. NSJ-177 TaxID=2931401 RepID=UPI001FD34840|nr:M20 family metallo-hydrolase [Cuneatibacter sp. NSJ-177]MCJ7837371.1 M20 family metallo-hydrolase [Cuneatibacter sp. NSJ-177]